MEGFQFRGTQGNYFNTHAEEGGILCIDSSVSISLGASISLAVPSQHGPAYGQLILMEISKHFNNNYQPNGADPINHNPHTAKQSEHVPEQKNRMFN